MGDEHKIEEFLRRTPAPELAEGDHRHALKRSLLRRMTVGDEMVREEGQAMARWRRRLAWTCAAVARVWGVVTDDPDFTEADAKQLVASRQEQLAKGEYELLGFEVDERGLRHYRYKILMPDGTEQIVGSGSHPDRDYVADVKEATALRKAGEGELIGYGERQNPMPFVMYEYRYDLPDGHTVGMGSNEPYLGSEDEDVREIKELFEGGQGELLGGPSTGQQVARYKVTLSDGRVMHYSTDSER